MVSVFALVRLGECVEYLGVIQQCAGVGSVPGTTERYRRSSHGSGCFTGYVRARVASIHLVGWSVRVIGCLRGCPKAVVVVAIAYLYTTTRSITITHLYVSKLYLPTIYLIVCRIHTDTATILFNNKQYVLH